MQQPARRSWAVHAAAAGDAANTGIGFLAAGVAIYGTRLPNVVSNRWIWLLGIAVVVQLSVGQAAGLYRGRWRRCSLDEAVALGGVVTIGAMAMITIDLALSRPVPIGAAITGGLFALVAMAATRCGQRVMTDRRLRPVRNVKHRVVVLGAGDGGDQVIHAMMRNPDSELVPVALLDDDPRKSSLRIMGIPVLGDLSKLATVARERDADTLLIAIPGMSSPSVREIAQIAGKCGLRLKVLPPVSELPDGVVRLSDVRAVTPRDMLGRREIAIDLDRIAGYLTGRRVLVTGAGGSIGSELCNQLARFAPERLVLLDRDESALHSVQLALSGHGLLDDRAVVVADIRDAARLHDVFAEHRPEVVFHTAALKHLPLLEMHPAEAAKTNVWGTYNVLDAAVTHGVERFVNISTDKAADPVSVLGWSKRLGERLTAAFAGDGAYLSVRFGNVLGSRGSVLHSFQAQIASGGPLTVTHPDVSRYFMTVEEAVRLLIHSAAIGRSGEVLVLDMGTPVRIADVARHMIEASGRDVDIVFTGLRSGEKMHEVLLGADEHDERPVHPMVSHVPVPPLLASALEALTPPVSDFKAMAEMRRLCTSTAPAPLLAAQA